MGITQLSAQLYAILLAQLSGDVDSAEMSDYYLSKVQLFFNIRQINTTLGPYPSRMNFYLNRILQYADLNSQLQEQVDEFVGKCKNPDFFSDVFTPCTSPYYSQVYLFKRMKKLYLGKGKNPYRLFWEKDPEAFITEIHEAVEKDSTTAMMFKGYKHPSQGVVDFSLGYNFRAIKVEMMLRVLAPLYVKMIRNGFPIQIIFPYVVTILAAYGNENIGIVKTIDPVNGFEYRLLCPIPSYGYKVVSIYGLTEHFVIELLGEFVVEDPRDVSFKTLPIRQPFWIGNTIKAVDISGDYHHTDLHALFDDFVYGGLKHGGSTTPVATSMALSIISPTDKTLDDLMIQCYGLFTDEELAVDDTLSELPSLDGYGLSPYGLSPVDGLESPPPPDVITDFSVKFAALDFTEEEMPTTVFFICFDYFDR